MEDRERRDDEGQERVPPHGRDREAAMRDFRNVDPAPTDPRAKEVALGRLRDASDEKLAVFEAKLREDALRAGATEREIREAQAGRPEHG